MQANALHTGAQRLVLTQRQDVVRLGLRLPHHDFAGRHRDFCMESNLKVNRATDLSYAIRDWGVGGRRANFSKVFWGRPYDVFATFFSDGAILAFAAQRKSLIGFDQLADYWATHARFTVAHVPRLLSRRPFPGSTYVTEFSAESAALSYKVRMVADAHFSAFNFYSMVEKNEDWAVLHFNGGSGLEYALRVRPGGTAGMFFLQGNTAHLCGVGSLLALPQSVAPMLTRP